MVLTSGVIHKEMLKKIVNWDCAIKVESVQVVMVINLNQVVSQYGKEIVDYGHYDPSD